MWAFKFVYNSKRWIGEPGENVPQSERKAQDVGQMCKNKNHVQKEQALKCYSGVKKYTGIIIIYKIRKVV